MKKILIIRGKRPELVQSVQEIINRSENALITASHYNGFNFFISPGRSYIIDSSTGDDLASYDQIFCLNSEPLEKGHILNAVSCYCRKNNIDMVEEHFLNYRGKLYDMWHFWELGLPVPKTAFGSSGFLGQCLVDNLNGIGVLKSISGTQGGDNYLVHSPEEISEIVANNPKIEFILQEFIPNNGDWRIVTLDYTPKFAIFRTASEGDYRNNTSAGASAKIIPLEDIDPVILDLAHKVTSGAKLRFAGVDVITNQQTGEHYILEVNRTPQMVSGAFVDEKREILLDYFSH